MGDDTVSDNLDLPEVSSKADAHRVRVEFYVKERTERIKAMIALQSFLFVALGFAWGKSKPLEMVLGSVGIVASACLAGFVGQCDRSLLELPRSSDSLTGADAPSSTFGSLRIFELSIGLAWGAIWLVAFLK